MAACYPCIHDNVFKDKCNAVIRNLVVFQDSIDWNTKMPYTSENVLALMLKLMSSYDRDSYLVTCPQTIIRGAPFEVTVDILNQTEDVYVQANLQKRVYNILTHKHDVNTLLTKSGVFRSGKKSRYSLSNYVSASIGFCLRKYLIIWQLTEGVRWSSQLTVLVILSW